MDRDFLDDTPVQRGYGNIQEDARHLNYIANVMEDHLGEKLTQKQVFELTLKLSRGTLNPHRLKSLLEQYQDKV